MAAFVAWATFAILGPAGFSVELFGATFVGATAAALVAGVSTLIASGIGMLTQRGFDAGQDNFGIKTTIRGAANARQIVYGECVVGGTLVHAMTSGTDNNKLHLIIAIAGHEIQSLEKLRINGIETTTSTSTVSGETVYRVTNSDFVNTDNANNLGSGSLIRYTFHSGTSSQTADGLAVANLTSWTTNHRLRGIAYVYAECVYDQEKWSGIPQLSFKVRGKKVFDPRDSSTAFSSNPALCILDYIKDTTNGLGALVSETNVANAAGSFYTAANTCDLNIVTTGSTTEDKYTMNGFFSTASAPIAVIESMLSSCAGKMTYSNGKFNLFVGQTQTPSLVITDDDVLSPIDISTNPSNSELYNGVKAVYVDKDNAYQAGDMPPYQDSQGGGFLAQDTPSGGATVNFERYLSLNYPYTTSQYTAQRLARIALKANRQTTTVSLLTTLKFYQLQVGDWVRITNTRMGYTNKDFEVQGIGFEADGDGFLGVRLVLKETADSVYAFDTSNDYVGVATTDDGGTIGGTTITAPSSLSLSAPTTYVVGTTMIVATWTKAPSPFVTSTEVEYKKTAEADSTYKVYSSISSSAVQATAIQGVSPATGYTVRIRSHSVITGAFSSYVSATITSGGSVIVVGDIDNDNIVEANLVGSGKTFAAGQKPNKSTFADGSTEGIFNFQLDGATAVGINVFSSAERTKLDRLRLGQDPANASRSIQNNSVTMSADGTLSGGGSSTQVNLNSIPDAGNTKTYAAYAGTGLDSSGRAKVGIVSGGVAVTAAEIKEAKTRAYAAINGSNKVVGTVTDGTTDFTPAELLKVRAGFDGLDGTAVLKVANANAALKNATIAIDGTTGVISGIGTADIKVNNAKTTKTDVGLPNVANETRATILGGTLTGQINDGTTNFTAAELLKVRAGFDGLDGTALLKVANANTALRNSGVTLAATGILSGGGTSVQVNIGSVAGSNFDTSGNISDGKTLTVSGSADNAKGRIVVGNITIDGYNDYILVEDGT